MASGNNEVTPLWQTVIWRGTGVFLAISMLGLFAFAAYMVWRLVGLVDQSGTKDLGFVFASMGVLSHAVLRLIAMLIGASIAFAGLAVSFYTHSKQTTLTVGTGSVAATPLPRASLATYAPGLLGVVVGAAIVVAAIFAVGEHTYDAGTSITYDAAQTEGKGDAKEPPNGTKPFAPPGDVFGKTPSHKAKETN